jgi:SAM-dependent methyltransferase
VKLLDHVHELLLAGHVTEGMQELLPALKARCQHAQRPEWEQVVQFCLGHPLRALLHQDPFTRHAFEKPRGYPGDAILLDFIYGHDEGWPLPPGTTALGQAVHQFTIRSAACEGVRTRREFVAHLLDDLAAVHAKPHVLSVAAGHLREAHLSGAVRRKRFGRFIALDADSQSLDEVERCYGRYGVEPLVASIRQLLLPAPQLGTFDLVYSTGLFDYLAQGTAQRLALALFELLRPRGRLVLANFLPGIPDLGYMQSYMGWELIYRTREEMLDVVARVPQPDVRDIRLFAEENQNILFLEVTRA